MLVQGVGVMGLALNLNRALVEQKFTFLWLPGPNIIKTN